MTKVDVAKKAISFTVGFGTSAIVNGIIKNNTAPSNLPEQIAMPVAGFVVAMMAVEATRKFTDAKVDEVVHWYHTNVKN